MSYGEYDPQEDPIYLQKKQIDILESISVSLREIRESNVSLLDNQDFYKRILNSINTNIFTLNVIVIIAAVYFAVKNLI